MDLNKEYKIKQPIGKDRFQKYECNQDTISYTEVTTYFNNRNLTRKVTKHV